MAAEIDLELLKHRIAELEAANKKKDGWDKAGVISQFISGFLIAGLGIAVTILVHLQDSRQKELEVNLNKDQFSAQQNLLGQQIDAQKVHDKAELDLETRKDYFDYLDKLSGAKPRELSLLLGQMEDTLTETEAAHTAVNYLLPPFSLSDKENALDNQAVYENALRVAKEFKKYDTDKLKHIARTHPLPQSEIAKAILGEPTRLLVRASEIDDFADLELENHPLIERMRFGGDSGWLPLTDSQIHRLAGDKSEYLLTFLVTNGDYGGYGGRLQISDGLQQYDTGPYAVNGCPCLNKPAFKVTVHLKHLPTHQLLIDREEVVHF